MATRNSNRRSRRPASTVEGRENQLISLAYDLVEKRFTEGTASAQETTFFLKLGSTRERLEQQKLQRENLLLSAKVDQIESGKTLEDLFKKAIEAMRTYTGQNSNELDL